MRNDKILCALQSTEMDAGSHNLVGWVKLSDFSLSRGFTTVASLLVSQGSGQKNVCNVVGCILGLQKASMPNVYIWQWNFAEILHNRPS